MKNFDSRQMFKRTPKPKTFNRPEHLTNEMNDHKIRKTIHHTPRKPQRPKFRHDKLKTKQKTREKNKNYRQSTFVYLHKFLNGHE